MMVPVVMGTDRHALTVEGLEEIDFHIDILCKIYTHAGVKLYKRPIRFDPKWWLVAMWY